QLLDFERQWLPRPGIHLETESSDGMSIRLVSLVPLQSALCEEFYLKRIDHRDPMTTLIQEFGDAVAISTGRFETSVNLFDMQGGQPALQQLEAFIVVVELFLESFLTNHEFNIQFQFCYVDTKNCF